MQTALIFGRFPTLMRVIVVGLGFERCVVSSNAASLHALVVGPYLDLVGSPWPQRLKINH